MASLRPKFKKIAAYSAGQVQRMLDEGGISNDITATGTGVGGIMGLASGLASHQDLSGTLARTGIGAGLGYGAGKLVNKGLGMQNERYKALESMTGIPRSKLEELPLGTKARALAMASREAKHQKSAGLDEAYQESVAHLSPEEQKKLEEIMHEQAGDGSVTDRAIQTVLPVKAKKKEADIVKAAAFDPSMEKIAAKTFRDEVRKQVDSLQGAKDHLKGVLEKQAPMMKWAAAPSKAASPVWTPTAPKPLPALPKVPAPPKPQTGTAKIKTSEHEYSASQLREFQRRHTDPTQGAVIDAAGMTAGGIGGAAIGKSIGHPWLGAMGGSLAGMAGANLLRQVKEREQKRRHLIRRVIEESSGAPVSQSITALRGKAPSSVTVSGEQYVTSLPKGQTTRIGKSPDVEVLA